MFNLTKHCKNRFRPGTGALLAAVSFSATPLR